MNFDHYAIVAPDPVFLRIGHLSIQWYAIFILTGVVLALFVSIREGKKKGFERDLFENLVLAGLPLCILGARLYFVLFNNLAWYLSNPGQILAIWQGGLAIHGAIIAAGLYAWWYLKRKKMPILPILDIAAVGFFIGQIIGRFGNFMNQEAHGGVVYGANLDAQREFLTSLLMPTLIVNGMFINGNYHHPTFLYEAIWNVIGLLIAVFILRRLSKLLIGEIAAFYLIWYSFGRMFIEALRTDSLMIGPLRMAQVISVVAIIGVTIVVIYRRKQEKEMMLYSTFQLADWQGQQKQSKKHRTKTQSSKHNQLRNKAQHQNPDKLSNENQPQSQTIHTQTNKPPQHQIKSKNVNQNQNKPQNKNKKNNKKRKKKR
ncbi:MAG: prolipoprotein diacylglyceryl transferase [Defluviitaleaceae bacterium]|nr:prolipoprotein diacylglyceryl transferase [Defluviitaleaceae bacterium]